MKALAAVLFTILCSNMSQAKLSCGALFKDRPQARLSKVNKFHFFNFTLLAHKLEFYALQKRPIAEVVKLPFKELENDIWNQIYMLENLISQRDFHNRFIKILAQEHQLRLIESLRDSITLEKHFELSLKTVMILDQKVKEYDFYGNSPNSHLSKFQQDRLARFLMGRMNDKEVTKAFPKMREFIVEWNRSLTDNFSSEKIILFSSMELPLTSFNTIISPAFSFIGIVDHKANPDKIGEIPPLRYASHDLAHHRIALAQNQKWHGLGADQRTQIMLAIRQYYLEARKKLKPRDAKSLDILYFDFLREESDVLPNFMTTVHQNRGKFSEHYTLQAKQVLSYQEVHGVMISSKTVYAQEIPLSNLDISNIDNLAISMKPYWRMLVDIWLKAYRFPLSYTWPNPD